MNVTLGSILFPERRKVVDTRKGLHNKRKKQVNAQKNQDQTSKQFTTRLLLDDETISPSDFLTPFPSDEVRNTEQFWEYLERVFYPVDERWVGVLDLSARPQNLEPREACIGLHFAYRWALADLFDTSELFKLVGNRGKIFKSVKEERGSRGESRRGADLVEQDKGQSPSESSNSGVSDQEEQMILSYLEFLDLPKLELIGLDPAVVGVGGGGEGSVKQEDESSRSRANSANPYFEEWKFLYQRLRYIEGEVDSMLSRLTSSIRENIDRDNSRKLLHRHQKKRCKEFLLKVMHYHSMRQFVDSLEEVLYFDEKTGQYLTTWDDGEAVRAAWMTQDQLLQLLLFRPNSTESKYSVSIPSECIPYAKSLDTYWLKYLLDSGLTMISDQPNSSQDDDRLGDTLNLDSPAKPKDGCIELSRHPLCHYCRRSCKRLSYSRCPSKLKPLNLGISPSGIGQSGQASNPGMPGSVLHAGGAMKLPGTSSSASSSNIYYSRSLIPWRVPRSQNSTENSDHTEPRYVSDAQHSSGHRCDQNPPHGKSVHSHSRSSVGGASSGSGVSYLLSVNGSHICNICTSFESNICTDALALQEEILVSRAYSPNNCWRMYCSECIMHNFSSVIKQKYSNGVVLRYYCPFCNGACNCERCLRNQQIRKIKNYLKSRFCGYIFQCSISSCVIQGEISWYDFLKDYGGDSLLLPPDSNAFKENMAGGETALMNESGEIDESLVNVKNLAAISYINNASRRLSVAENTHLGFIWLQANNIPFQKPPSSSSGANPVSGDSNSKNSTAPSDANTGASSSDPGKQQTKSKSRSRSSIGGTQKNKRNSSGQSSTGNCSLANPNDKKHPQSSHHTASNNAIHTNTSKSGSTLAGTSRSGAHNLPPSIHVPREVTSEPTQASGSSVLWSLRSILINNVNKYHRECLSNLERWESTLEVYNRKRMELEGYFEELVSKLNVMDEWIRSISFTETNKRLIMRKMPLLCWATDVPSSKPFSFDDYPQLVPGENVVDMIKHVQNFVNNGIISEDLPNHEILGISESGGKGVGGVSQKTTPKAKLIDKLPGMMSTGTPSSVMEFLMSSISEIQNIVVKTNTSSSKDESGKASRIQRNLKKDKSASKSSTQAKPPNGDSLSSDEVNRASSSGGNLPSDKPAESSSSAAEPGGNQADGNSPINAEFIPSGHDILEAASSSDHTHPCGTSGKSIAGNHLEHGGVIFRNMSLVDTQSSSINPYIFGDESVAFEKNYRHTFQTCSNKAIPGQGPSMAEYLQQNSRKRKLSPELASDEPLTPERRKELIVRRKHDGEPIKITVRRSSVSPPASPKSPSAIGAVGAGDVEEISSLSGDGTSLSVSSSGSNYGSPKL
ncbi:RING domain-containing protein [Cryptosporidium canis]|nr:RING domain-containing protein [Cryptosporidium canis]